MTFQIIAVLLS